MKKLFTKKTISLIMVILVMISTIGFANAGGNDVVIKSIIFQDENNNMVYVDYAEAIEQSLEGDKALYDAIVHYVGIAEEKGRLVYLETEAGVYLDYGKALTDNLSRLADIIDVEKYIVRGEIKYTHELWIDDGKPVITDPEAKPAQLVSITEVDGIEVEIGTTEETAKSMLPSSTTILDSRDRTHTVALDWAIENYDKDVIGNYNAIGRFELPRGVVNKKGIDLKVEAIVKVFEPVVEPEFPVEVESVFIIKSEITENTYANINIKEEYVSIVDEVKVDGKLANQIEDNSAQWRIKVEEETTAEDLKGRISVSTIVKEGKVQVGLYKNYRIAGNGINFGELKGSFYIKNKITGKEYKEGTSPWNSKYLYQMKDIPVGEYTIHFDVPEGMDILKVQIGNSYDETDYDAETNPLVVKETGKGIYDNVIILLKDKALE